MPKTIEKKIVLVFGTFDGLHKGHLDFFKQAKSIYKNSLLFVSLALDTNVKKIKGKKPRLNQTKRLALVKKLKLVNKAFLGAKKDYLGHILAINPSAIALGYDQKAYTHRLKNELKKKGLLVKVVRLKAFKPHLYKSSKIWAVDR